MSKKLHKNLLPQYLNCLGYNKSIQKSTKIYLKDKMTVISNQNIEEQIRSLEGKFDTLRVYGDERDFEIFEVKESQNGKNCRVPIRASFLYPELKNDPQNKRFLSVACAENALVAFVKYKFRNLAKTVSYDRIEDKTTEAPDLSNSCAIQLSSYLEIIKARRAGPEKAKAISQRLLKNIALINQYKWGKITEEEYKEEMSRRNAEIEKKQSRPRTMERLREDNEALLQHIEKYIGKIGKSIHDQAFSLAPLSVHIIPETRDGKGGALVTTGMSVLPMHVPGPYKAFKFSELLFRVPKDWPLPLKELKKDDYFWLIEELLHLMKYVHENQRWFFDMHTFGNGDPPQPYSPNTNFCGLLFTLPVLSLPAEFCELQIDDSKTVIFLQILPLYKEEMDLVITDSSEALLKKFEEQNSPDYVDINRKSLVGSGEVVPGKSKTAGMWCPNCLNTIRNFKPEGVRCSMCKSVLVNDQTGELRALDIPEEKASVSKKAEKKAETLFFDALSYLDKNAPEKALKLLTQAFKLNPYDSRYWSVKSTVLYELGRYKEAFDCGTAGLKYL